MTDRQSHSTDIDTQSDGTLRVMHRGVDIVVSAKQNDRGAWIPEIAASVDGKPFALPAVETVTPEWTTQAEALRDGVERGCYLVERCQPGSGLEDSARGTGQS
ncbi:DUF6566 family protein [Paraburkholderia rhynchosiae]|uniref:DUF6566 domain-containing protein n=1 Tax=Paraburkholderia rhynchosiae TaxID=487049 RepID=A0A2N7WKK5_9BURK|nr:DUF6566 family protein [Paraburkholderia rhynchosiae]PMS29933.1 hypothetical protein C0Z16_15900 [Paraburkholderia rhynchosiae]CAB3695858.1 hypothetical protein LMG27174_03412 [Paraburkholderia rhynchosiae]